MECLHENVLRIDSFITVCQCCWNTFDNTPKMTNDERASDFNDSL